MWYFPSFLLRVRLASIALRPVHAIDENADSLRSWRYGEIELSDGKLVAIYPRWWPRLGSRWESYQDSYNRKLPVDVCRVYYSFPLRAPGYMSVLYAHSGSSTRYKTIRRAVLVIDAIAVLNSSNAIICQIINERGTERLMKRWGYVRHATSLGDNHYIKRIR